MLNPALQGLQISRPARANGAPGLVFMGSLFAYSDELTSNKRTDFQTKYDILSWYLRLNKVDMFASLQLPQTGLRTRPRATGWNGVGEALPHGNKGQTHWFLVAGSGVGGILFFKLGEASGDCEGRERVGREEIKKCSWRV